MIKIIKVGQTAFIQLSCGVTLSASITDDEFKLLSKVKTDEEALLIIDKEYKKKYDNFQEYNELLAFTKDPSSFISYINNAFYWYEISSLSLPVSLVKDIYKAVKNKEDNKLTAYKNFWTLMSLNTDEDCRNNLYAFLQRHDFKIAKCGFFVGYRNVDTTKEEGVYTDHYSHTTRIKIGEMVTLDRSKCNCDSNVECSDGLHVSGTNWITKNYYGDTGIAVLVNPADVVAVPKRSNYGKLRTCAYLPMAIIKYGSNDKVIPLDLEDGFDCSYVTKVIYEGVMGTEEDSPYKIEVPKAVALTYEQQLKIQDTLLDIAKDCIINKQL